MAFYRLKCGKMIYFKPCMLVLTKILFFFFFLPTPDELKRLFIERKNITFA